MDAGREACAGAGGGRSAARALGSFAALAQSEPTFLAPSARELALEAGDGGEAAEAGEAACIAGGVIDASQEAAFERLLAFLRAKRELDGVAERVLPGRHMEKFPSFGGGARQSCQTLDAVFASGARAADPFAELVAAIAAKASLGADAARVAPLKGRARAREKAADDYKGDAARLVDVVRGTLVARTEPELIAASEAVAAEAAVVRFKNRFLDPPFNGYRDALYTVAVAVDGDEIHLCEIQVHLAPLLALKAATHPLYAHFRTHFAGNLSAVHERLRVLGDVADGLLDADGDQTLGGVVRRAIDGGDQRLMAALETLLGTLLGA